MEDGNGRVEVGLQLPAHRMDEENRRVEGGLQLPAHEDGNRRVEGRQQLPARGMEGLEDGQRQQEGQQESVEEEEVNGVLRNMANLLNQQGLQGPAIVVAPIQQGGHTDQPDAGEDQQGDVYMVAGRERPVLPPPLPGPVAAGDGWEAIDRIGAEAAFRVCCPMLQQVDTQHSSAWARAHGYVLRRWQEATTEEEVDRALMWLGFLSQALQWKPVGRGGKNGRNQVKFRYHCVVEGDWGGIVAAWEQDREKLEETPRRDREETEEEKEARTSTEVR
jgi:hypothetical protein